MSRLDHSAFENATRLALLALVLALLASDATIRLRALPIAAPTSGYGSGVYGGGAYGHEAPSLTFAVAHSSSACNGQTPTVTSTTPGSSVMIPDTFSPAVAVQTLDVTTNAQSGFVINLRTAQPLQTLNGAAISGVPGTNAAPASFPVSGSAFGYTTSETNLSGPTPDRFVAPATQWAAHTQTDAQVSRATVGPVMNKIVCVAHKVAISEISAAGHYSTTIVYTAVPTF